MGDPPQSESGELLPARSLEQIAVELNEAHASVIGHIRAGLEDAIRAGGLLAEAKADVKRAPGGRWLPWLAANFDGSERTAQVYRKLYDRRDEIRGASDIRSALRILVGPKPERRRLPGGLPDHGVRRPEYNEPAADPDALALLEREGLADADWIVRQIVWRARRELADLDDPALLAAAVARMSPQARVELRRQSLDAAGLLQRLRDALRDQGG